MLYTCVCVCVYDSELRSLERLNSASGNADSFEAVLAEEMHAMRESFEQKMLSLKAQIDRKASSSPNPETLCSPAISPPAPLASARG
jgi:hypothetical protein